MPDLLNALAPLLRERAGPAWWDCQPDETDDHWRERTASALRQLGCSPTWNRASVRKRPAALRELFAAPQRASRDRGVAAVWTRVDNGDRHPRSELPRRPVDDPGDRANDHTIK